MYTWTQSGVVINVDHEGPPTAAVFEDPRTGSTMQINTSWPGMTVQGRGVDDEHATRSQQRMPGAWVDTYLFRDPRTRSRSTDQTPQESAPEHREQSANPRSRRRIHRAQALASTTRDHETHRLSARQAQRDRQPLRGAESESQTPEHAVRFREGEDSVIGSESRERRIREGEGYRHVRPLRTADRDLAAGRMRQGILRRRVEGAAHPTDHVNHPTGPPNGGRPLSTRQDPQVPPNEEGHDDFDDDDELACALSLSMVLSKDNDETSDPFEDAPNWPDCQICGKKPQNVRDTQIGFCFECYGEEKAAQAVLSSKNRKQEGD